MSEKDFESRGCRCADAETQTRNIHTKEEVTAINAQTGNTDTKKDVTTSAQTYNTRGKDATTHSKDSDVQSRFSDSNDLADFDGEEIPAEVTDAISG